MSKLKTKEPAEKPKAEPDPDAWARFEKAIHKIAPPRKAKPSKTEKPK